MSPEKTNEVDALHDASHRLMIFLQREGIIDVGTNKADRAKALELAQELLGLHPADPDLAIRLHTLSGEEKFELALMFQREVVRVTRGEQRVSEIVSQEKKRSLVFTGLLERMRQTVEGFDQ